MNDTTGSQHNACREFRSRLINKLSLNTRSQLSSYLYEKPYTLKVLRKKIKVFREHLAFQGESTDGNTRLVEIVMNDGLMTLELNQ